MDAKSFYLSKPWLKFYEPGVPAEPEVPLRSVTQVFDEAAEKFASKTALIFYGREISFRELRGQCERFAAALAGLPSRRPSWANACSDRPSSFGFTIPASSATLSTASMRRPPADTCTLVSAWKPAARYTAHSRCR